EAQCARQLLEPESPHPEFGSRSHPRAADLQPQLLLENSGTDCVILNVHPRTRALRAILVNLGTETVVVLPMNFVADLKLPIREQFDDCEAIVLGADRNHAAPRVQRCNRAAPCHVSSPICWF